MPIPTPARPVVRRSAAGPMDHTSGASDVSEGLVTDRWDLQDSTKIHGRRYTMRRIDGSLGVFRKQCLACGKPFHAEGPGCGQVVTCAEECRRIRRLALRRELRRRRPPPRVTYEDRACKACGESFTPRRSDAVFCSVRCRVAHHRLVAGV